MKLTQDERNKLGSTSISIVFVRAKYTNGCSPSQNQYILCKKKSGEYSKVTSQILHQIVTHTTLKTNGFADADYICSLMKHALPKRVSISAKNIYNVRVRANMLKKKLHMNNHSLVSFKFSPAIVSDLFTPLDQATNYIACVAEVAKDLYLSYINDEKGSFTFFSYLE